MNKDLKEIISTTVFIIIFILILIQGFVFFNSLISEKRQNFEKIINYKL